MNACETCREQIDLHMDGQVNARHEATLNAHLAQCADCGQYEAAQRALSADLDLLSRVADDLAAPRIQMTRTTPNWMAIGSRAAAVVLVILGTWVFVRQLSPIPNAVHPLNTLDPNGDSTAVPPPTRFAATVEPADSGSRFVVPIETDNPRIHVVWLYDSPDPIQQAAPSSAPDS